MAKAYNQNFYSLFLYGSQTAGGALTLQANDTLTPGIVQIVSTSLDLYIGGVAGRFVHANTALRTYTLPDYDGTFLTGGLYTAANQLIYSTGANAFTTLTATNSSILSTTALGVPTWVTGTSGQFLQITGGLPTFGPLPADVGTIASSVGNTLPVYQSPGPSNALVPLSTVSNMVLASPSGNLAWSLVTAAYLAASGDVPLGDGIAGQKLWSNGDGTFEWVNDPSVVNAGAQNFISYYSAPGTAYSLSASGFVSVDEVALAFNLTNGGVFRLYEQIVNGTAYVELKAPSALGGTVVFTLPGADGSPGAYLKTDGSGNLSFISANNGAVNNALVNQLAYYAATGNAVSGLATSGNCVLLSPSNVPTWGLVSAPYLAGLGGSPLANGTPSQILTSNGDGTVSWTTASALTGSVTSGNQYQAAYYAAGGTAVSGSSFLNLVDPSGRVDITNNGVIRIYELATNGTNWVQLQVPALIAANVTFTLPGADGAFSGYALTTNASGTLTFTEVGQGIVDAGAANTLALYTGASTTTGHGVVEPLTSVASMVLLTNASAVPSWSLVSATYLETTGGVALDDGLNNQVLTSNGDGTFSWQNVSALVGGGVGAGGSGSVTFYKSSGSAVVGSSFLYINDPTMDGYIAPPSLQLQQGGVLQLFEATTSTYYNGFKAAAALSSDITWTLPTADAAGALVSNGSGILSFSALVEPGATGAIAYYPSGAASVSPASVLTYTATTLTVGAASYSITGQSGGTPGALTIASGNGTGVAGANLSLNAGSGTTSGKVLFQVAGGTLAQVENLYLTLANPTALRFFDSTVNYVGFEAPSTVSASVIWTLPTADGSSSQVLSTTGAGTLFWQSVVAPTVTIQNGVSNALSYYTSPTNIAASSLLAPVGIPTSPSTISVSVAGQMSYAPINQGNITVPSGSSTVTVLYDTPFASTPAVVVTQWSIEGATLPASLPTVAVLAKDTEGFTLQLSTTTTQSYTLYWEAIQNGYVAPTAQVFLAGGYDGTSLYNTIQAFGFDTDTSVTTPATLSSDRAFTAGTSSATNGFILGGEILAASSNIITTFSYATSTATDQSATLVVHRSDATGVGTRLVGYACGGQTIGSGNLTSIGRVDEVAIVATTLAATLTTTALDTGSANSSTTGYMVHSDANSTVDKLSFTSETVSAGPNSFGAGTVVVAGCNDNIHATGYFALSTGALYSYAFSTDTITSLGVSTGLTSGGAGNSLVNGYFAAGSNIDRLTFQTATLTTAGAPAFSATAASMSTFQTNGLI